MKARLHASAVRLGERAVLITGPSGSGKSSLALALLMRPVVPRGALPAALDADLVADDQTWVSVHAGRLVAAPDPALRGLLEVRGQGLRHLPHAPRAVVGLVVERAPGPRLPDREDLTLLILGVAIPRVYVAPDVPDPVDRVLAFWLGAVPNGGECPA